MKISIVIPALNEEEGIKASLNQIPVESLNQKGYEVEVLVVDNGSTDRTAEIATENGARVIAQPIRGYGNAYKAGFENATGDIIVTGDADSTYPLDDTLPLLEMLAKDNLDFLNTNRLENLNKESMTRWHVFGNWVLTTMSYILYGSPFKDSQSGMWVFKRNILKDLDLESGGMPFSQELKMEAYWKGFKCAETAIEYRPRLGEVKLRGLHDAFLNVMQLIQKRLVIKRSSERKSLKTSNKKNIVIVSTFYTPHLGGVEIVTQNQAQRLAAVGNKVTVITSKIGSNKTYGMENGVQVIRISALNFTERWGAPFPIFSPQILFVLAKSIKNADIVHLHDAFYMSSFLGALYARMYKKPVLLMQHVALIKHPSLIVTAVQKIVYATTGKIIFTLSNTIIVLNNRVRDFLITQGVPEKKILAFVNGVDSELFHPVHIEEKQKIRSEFNLSQHKKIILFVGRFVPKKGFNKVLAAKSSEYQLVFAGGMAPQPSTDEAIFLGNLSQEKLAKIYQAADIFILPSEDEGFPLSVQEAMATGLPIITQHDYGYDCYNFDKEKIHFIEKATTESVQKAIRDILQDDERMKSMSVYSHEYAHAHFKWSDIIVRLENIYNTLAA